MIRFRIGQQWKREAKDSLTDSVSLELHGVNLLAGAVDEPLTEVIPALVGAMASLRAGARSVAEVSFSEAHLELVLRRVHQEVELQVAHVGRPAQLLRPPVTVEFAPLVGALRETGAGFLSDLEGRAPTQVLPERREALRKGLLQLTRPDRFKAVKSAAVHQRMEAAPGLGFGFELQDAAGVLRLNAKQGGAGLGSLLAGGSVWLQLPGVAELCQYDGPPFLKVLELSRQAAELVRALELGEKHFRFELAAGGPRLELSLAEGKARLGDVSLDLQATALAAAMFELGLDYTRCVTELARTQTSNPYLEELVRRCREGWAHLKGATQPPPEEGSARDKRADTRHALKPLPSPGRLRRLRFEKLWEVRDLPGADLHSRLLLHRQGPLYSSAGTAMAFAKESGKVLWRHSASHGVACAPDGAVLAADADRVLGFKGKGDSARWLHDHDGLPLGPTLHQQDKLWLTLSEGRTAVAFAEAGGREMWRLAPPKTQRSHLTVQGHRVLLATDSGYLYGLDIADGQVRFRMRAQLPFHAAPAPWGKRFVGMLGRGDHFAFLLADAHSGQSVWTRELNLGHPSPPLPAGKQLYFAGERNGEGLLGCLSLSGQTRWETRLQLGEGPFTLATLPQAVLASSATGATTRLNAEGRVSWLLGSPGEALNRPIAPVVSRGVVFVAGETVRAVEAASGQVLAEVKAGPGLWALQADAKLNLYFLDEAGTLSAYRLATHFAVVPKEA